MAVYNRGQSGRKNHAVGSSHYSQSNHEDKAPESVPIIEAPGEKIEVKRTENQLSRLARGHILYMYCHRQIYRLNPFPIISLLFVTMRKASGSTA